MSDKLNKIIHQIEVFKNKAESHKNSGNSGKAHEYQEMVNKLLIQKEDEEKHGAIIVEREKLREEINEKQKKVKQLKEKHRIINESIANYKKLETEFVQSAKVLFRDTQGSLIKI